jgi:hypothetical protein
LAAEGTYKEFSERFEKILEKSISLTANAKREVGL